MELINGDVNIVFLLLLALSSLFSAANAICVPRSSSEFQSPADSQLVRPQSPSPATDPAPAPTAGSDEPYPAFAPTNLVQICDVTSNPKLCQSSISSQVEESTMSPTSALKTEIGESIKVVESAVAQLKALRKDSKTSNVEIQCFDTCLENFDLAIFDLKAGLESIDAKDIGRMESMLTAVLSNLMTCEDTFAEMGVDSPLDNISTKMDKYASNCLAISKLLM